MRSAKCGAEVRRRISHSYCRLNIMFQPDKPAGLYIHAPFCVRKCHYCNFFSITDHAQIPDYVAAVKQEMRMAAAAPLKFDTLFFGGGTPSLLSGADIGGLIAAAYRWFDLQPDTEISLEANPGTATRQKLKDFSAAGVNRLTIGIQSFQPRILTLLGRIHSAEEGAAAIRQARLAGFRNLGLDLIYGVPGQTAAELIADLKQAVSWEPAHISAYMLTVEPGTRLADMIAQGELALLSEQTIADFFLLIADFFAAQGYAQYEISNYARTTADISRHNFKYWTLAPYLGLGPSAHSYRRPRRSWNHASVNRYLASIRNGQPPTAGQESLNSEQQWIEAIFLGLRTAQGIDLHALRQMFRVSFAAQHQALIDELTAQGLAEITDHCFRLTRSGMMFHEAIVARLL